MKPAKSLLRAAASVVLLAAAARPQRAPAPFTLRDAFPAQEKFDLPLYLASHRSDPDRFYVVEQDGLIHRIPRDGRDGGREEFLDWRAECLRANWEEGLLGFAFDPEYDANQHFYVYYSREVGAGSTAEEYRRRERQSVISRLDKVDGIAGPVADPDSELVLMTIPQPYGNHNGGTIVFGPDGMLYVALGDGGAANDPHGNGQNRGTLLGSVLRIDVRDATAERPYRVPPDNPFAGEDGARGEIWAFGLRNPWRISFDRETGELWCGDVGQNRWEEVDRLVEGGNYGWNYMEGNHPFELGHRRGEPPGDLIPPVAEYPREDGISVTGGYVYRGERYADLRGRYVYGDFGTGRIWAVREDRKHGRHDVRLLCESEKPISSFAERPDGELLVICFDGHIYELARAE